MNAFLNRVRLFCYPIRMMLLMLLTSLWMQRVRPQPEMVLPGPTLGIVSHLLQQLQKLTVIQDKQNGSNRHFKGFLGALLWATVGTLFNIGVTSINAFHLATVRQHVSELQEEVLHLHNQLTVQTQNLQATGKTIVLNTHSNVINQTVKSLNQLFPIIQWDHAHNHLVSLLTLEALCRFDLLIAFWPRWSKDRSVFRQGRCCWHIMMAKWCFCTQSK